MFSDLLDLWKKFRSRVKDWWRFNWCMGAVDCELVCQIEDKFRDQYISLDDRYKITKMAVEVIRRELAEYHMLEADIDPNECFNKYGVCIGLTFTISYRGLVHCSCVHFVGYAERLIG